MTTRFYCGTRNILAVILLLFLLPFFAYAEDALLEVAPDTGTYIAGETMTLSVFASSGGQSANAVEAKLSYDPKSIAVISVSREGSLISSWTEEPMVDETNGLISFGGMLATSTTLERGRVLLVHLRPLRIGDTRIHFESGAAVHAADGTGGNILSGFRDGHYVIEPKELSPEADTLSGEGEVLGLATATPAVLITSPTHPDQEAWYRATSSVFTFQVEPSVTKIRLGFDQKVHGQVRVTYAPNLTTKTIDRIDEGVWYLHLSASVLGGETFNGDYRVQIDHTPPEQLAFTEVARSDSADPNVIFTVNATDTLSGIDHYLFGVDGEEAVRLSGDEQQFRYRAPAPGVHVLHVSAVDKAGNMLSRDQTFDVTYLSSPRLTPYDGKAREGEPLRLSITAPKNSTLNIDFSRNGGAPTKEEVVVDGAGNASFVSQAKLAPGVYRVVAVASDVNGGVSKESEPLTLEVSPSLWGLLTRHPFIPVALLLLIGLIVAFKRFVHTKHKKKSPAHTVHERVVHKPEHMHKQGTVHGRIVLQPRAKDQKHHLPPVRLR